MIQASNQFIEAITAESRQFKASLLCDEEELECEITSIEIHKGASGDQIVPGAVFIPYMEFSVRNCSAELTGKTIAPIINLVVGYDANNEPIYDEDGIRLGRFIATKPLRTTDSLSCKAVGKLSMRGGLTYTSTLTYPAALADVITELSSRLNMPIILKGLNSSAKTIEVSMSGELLRDALGYVGCILGGFVTEDNAGNIVISKYGAGETLEVAPWKSQSQPSFAEDDWECTGIKVIVSEEREEEGEDLDGNSIAVIIPEVSYSHGTPNIVVFNPYMTEALFNSMYPCIEGYSFRPGSIDMNMGDPRLEAWDYLAIEDLNGTTHTMPCLNISHKYHGGCESSISCDIKTSFEEEAETIGPVSKQLASAINDADIARSAAEYARTTAEGVERIAKEARSTADYIDQAAFGSKTYSYIHDGVTETVYKDEQGEYYYFDDGERVSVAEESLEHDEDDELIVNRDDDGLNTLVSRASDSAVAAGEAADRAEDYAEEASIAATTAGNTANKAVAQLADIEKVVDVLSWTAEHGKYEKTTDEEVAEGRYYFIKTGENSYQVVEHPTGNPSANDWYELSGVDEVITNYVASHLALVDDGLYLQMDNSDYKIHIAPGGIYLMKGPDTVAKYSTAVTLGDTNDMHIILSNSELGFYQGPNNKVAYINTSKLFITNAEITNSLRIGNFLWTPRSGRLTLIYSPV